MSNEDAGPADYLGVAKQLVEAKADLHTKNNAGQTPFHVACSGGYLDMVKFLLEAGSDPNTVDNQGATPLNSAQQRGHAEIVAYLCPLILPIGLGH